MLLVGIGIGIWGVRAIALVVTILMVILLIVTFYGDNGLFHHILMWV